jgi:hypothetical protein
MSCNYQHLSDWFMLENIPYSRPLNNRKQHIVGYFSGQNIHMTGLFISLALQINTCPSKFIESDASFRNSGSRTDLHRRRSIWARKVSGSANWPLYTWSIQPDSITPQSSVTPKVSESLLSGVVLSFVCNSATSPCLDMYSFRSPGITDV